MNVFISSSSPSHSRSKLPALSCRKFLADWGVLLGMVKVLSALSELHPKSSRGSFLFWVKLLMLLGQGLRQESSWSDSCPPVEVERNYHRSQQNLLLLPLDNSQNSSSNPQEQKTTLPGIAASGRWWVISQGLLLPGLSEEMSSPLCNPATSLLRHFVLLLTRKPFCLITVFPDSKVGVHRCTQLPVHDLMLPKGWCCLSSVLLDVNMHRSERNVSHRGS